MQSIGLKVMLILCYVMLKYCISTLLCCIENLSLLTFSLSQQITFLLRLDLFLFTSLKEIVHVYVWCVHYRHCRNHAFNVISWSMNWWRYLLPLVDISIFYNLQTFYLRTKCYCRVQNWGLLDKVIHNFV
jgi:hypothetical protein